MHSNCDRRGSCRICKAVLGNSGVCGSPRGERDICLAALSAATGFVKNYTGIKLDETAAREKTAEYDVAEELGYAVKVIAAEMIDNRQVTMQYTGRNPTVMQILDMHSVNLLPSAEE